MNVAQLGIWAHSSIVFEQFCFSFSRVSDFVLLEWVGNNCKDIQYVFACNKQWKCMLCRSLVGSYQYTCERESKWHFFNIINSLKFSYMNISHSYVCIWWHCDTTSNAWSCQQIHSKFFPLTYSVFLHTLGLANKNCLNVNFFSTKPQ